MKEIKISGSDISATAIIKAKELKVLIFMSVIFNVKF